MKKAHFFRTSILLAALLSGCSSIHEDKDTTVIKKACVPAAHRGDREAGPDNSRQAISAAVREKIPFIEVDLRLSQSGSLFLFHDRRLQTGAITSSTDLIGRSFSSLNDGEIESLRLPNGEKIPRFGEALHLVQGSESKLLLDLKLDSPKLRKLLVTQALEDITIRNSVVVQCQTADCISFFSAHSTKPLFLARVHKEENLTAFAKANPFILQVDPALLSKAAALVDADGPLLLLVKTLGEPPDEPASWDAVCSRGADIVLTDTPLTFLKYRANIKRSPPGWLPPLPH